MDRASIYFMNETDRNTYDFDETLPALPLPELADTMQRYYESVKPFATPEQLAHTREIIERFERGIGAELQAKLKLRATTMKNWLGAWWEDYGYHLIRLPLAPYQLMAMVAQLEVVGVPETPEYALKSLARQAHHTLQFWDLLRKATIKPMSSNGGKVKYSSALYKRFFSTSRVPGADKDHIEQHFRIKAEGETPKHLLVSGKGRQFVFPCVHADDSILTAPELLVIFQRIRATLDYAPEGDCVPVLTHDERSAWATNRWRLTEISTANKETLKLVESSAIDICFDENEPKNYEETAQTILYGDYHSKWGDRSSTVVAYKNGRFAYNGEHSCYDGTVPVSYAIFIQLSLLECPEPDWDEVEHTRILPISELKFELDETIRSEIRRVRDEISQRGFDVTVSMEVFGEYGKELMKHHQLHPDSFSQVVMQWTYHQLHEEIAPTYETALMRHYYNGRTETLRSCTAAVAKFLEVAANASASSESIVAAFCAAVNDHKYMMDEARRGHGVDRHIFGLWCAAHENNLETPEIFNDPLYSKSGGGGNFVLSSSTLGATSNVGFVSPMIFDGYGVFYSIASGAIFITTTAYRDSPKTSARKFNEMFKASFSKIRTLLAQTKDAKL